MRAALKSLLPALITGLLLSLAMPVARAADTPKTILYGAAYYHEYMPYERLAKDVELMKAAGFTCVRMGESTWTSWEPRDGEFQFEWMDRVVDAMHKAGIQVIMGTPTYSIPPWMYKKHPEILVLHYGAAGPQWDPWSGTYPGPMRPGYYGPRQNMDLTNPDYRRYCERIIRKIAEHYAHNPAVIGWQVDNETAPNGIALPNVQRAFVEQLKEKYGTPQRLDQLWGLTYWGQLVDNWDEFPSREGILNPGYKLEWARFQRSIVTEFLAWQARILREYIPARQFVTQDFGGFNANVDHWAIGRAMDIAATNIYFTAQDKLDGMDIALGGDFFRSVKNAPYLVTETNAQTIGWDSRAQYPPYDGQLRLEAFAHAASGATLVEYWHWHSLHYGQETYWRGVLGQDLEPNRAYAEVATIGADFKRLGRDIGNLKKSPRVAILFSTDSSDTISYMPFSDHVDYMTMLRQMYAAAYALKTEVDFVTPETRDLSKYKVLLVPPLYSASDEVLKRIAAFVENGGHAIVAFKSGFTNEYSTVRWERAPGPLRQAAGFSYQDFSNLAQPLALKPDRYGVGARNQASVWAEFLLPEGAETLLTYDHPFFGRYPALTRQRFGRGTLTYEGTVLSGELQQAVVREVMQMAGLESQDWALPAPVQARHGVNARGHAVHYYLNYSGARQEFVYPYVVGRERLKETPVATNAQLTLEPWGVAIVEEGLGQS
jgi:beta-galactosidase